MRQSGFTLVELIVVMIIVGILAVAALPRFFESKPFEARAFHDRVLSMVRYGQKVAIAQRTNVFVNADAASKTVCLTYAADPACAAATGVTDPASAAKFSITAPTGITLSGSFTFFFSPLGQPNPAPAPLGIISDGTTTITVTKETGYVY